MAISITGGDILGEGLERRDLAVADGLIAAFDTAPRAGALRLDATGLLVLPGLVDCHGDAFERHVMPRPRVAFDIDLALKDADRALLANGITTAFHGVTWSWEPGLRGAQNARALAESIDKLQPELGADTRFHLRHETFNLDAEPQILDWLAQGRIGVLAFNDHTEGTLKTRHRPDKIGKMVERTGLSTEAFMALVETVYARKSEVEGSIARLAAAARAAGVTMFSHDDMTPDMRAWYRSLGVTVAEFPIDEATARAAEAHGEAIVFGAPNVVRGGSHTGCPSAEDMVRAGLCTILASITTIRRWRSRRSCWRAAARPPSPRPGRWSRALRRRRCASTTAASLRRASAPIWFSSRRAPIPASSRPSPPAGSSISRTSACWGEACGASWRLRPGADRGPIPRVAATGASRRIFG